MAKALHNRGQVAAMRSVGRAGALAAIVTEDGAELALYADVNAKHPLKRWPFRSTAGAVSACMTWDGLGDPPGALVADIGNARVRRRLAS